MRDPVKQSMLTWRCGTVTWGEYLQTIATERQADSLKSLERALAKQQEYYKYALSNLENNIIASTAALERSFHRHSIEQLASMEDLRADFNYGLSAMINLLEVQNSALQDIAVKLDEVVYAMTHRKTEDSKELRERAFYKLTIGRVEEALETFWESFRLNDEDLVVMLQIGLLYLYETAVEKSEAATEKAYSMFKRAAQGAYVEARRVPDTAASASIREMSAEIHLHYSWACYVLAWMRKQRNASNGFDNLLSEALEAAERGLTVHAGLDQLYYHAAKYAALLGKSKKTLDYSQKAIEKDRLYAVKIFDDGDFEPFWPQLRELLSRIRMALHWEVSSQLKKYQDLLGQMREWQCANDDFQNVVWGIESHLNAGTYFDVLDARALFNEKKFTEEHRRFETVRDRLLKSYESDSSNAKALIEELESERLRRFADAKRFREAIQDVKSWTQPELTYAHLSQAEARRKLTLALLKDMMDDARQQAWSHNHRIDRIHHRIKAHFSAFTGALIAFILSFLGIGIAGVIVGLFLSVFFPSLEAALTRNKLQQTVVFLGIPILIAAIVYIYRYHEKE